MHVTGRALTRAIGRRLPAERSARGLSVTGLSALTGDSISVSRISHYELGLRRLGIDAARTLAGALGGVSAAHLLCLKCTRVRLMAVEQRLVEAFRRFQEDGRRRVMAGAWLAG